MRCALAKSPCALPARSATWNGQRYSRAVVSTSYELVADEPLHVAALRLTTGLRYWWGINGAQSGRERWRQAKRASHLGRFPMETVRQVERPTTLILDDEVPRVPKRAAFLERALQRDLGEKSQRERTRFSFKHPLSRSQLGMIRRMVPFRDGPVAGAVDQRFRDPQANARAIKSLSYFLGAGLIGICEIPRYAWFSHKEDGMPIELYHRYAVVMLSDQGYDTMEGASGDDWISGAQSMRGYLRGADIAGIIAETLRASGFHARSQTNADSDVLHIPLIKVVDADGASLTRAASWLGVNAMWLKPLLVPIATWLDDKLGNGKRVAAKKWWFDLEMVDGIAVKPKGTNERDIDPGRKVDPRSRTIAFYPASAMPPPDAAGAVPVQRKAAIAARDGVETPASAWRRVAEHGPKPPQYVPTPAGGQHASRAP